MGRPAKYTTDEERREAELAKKRRYNDKNRIALRKANLQNYHSRKRTGVQKQSGRLQPARHPAFSGDLQRGKASISLSELCVRQLNQLSDCEERYRHFLGLDVDSNQRVFMSRFIERYLRNQSTSDEMNERFSELEEMRQVVYGIEEEISNNYGIGDEWSKAHDLVLSMSIVIDNMAEVLSDVLLRESGHVHKEALGRKYRDQEFAFQT